MRVGDDCVFNERATIPWRGVRVRVVAVDRATPTRRRTQIFFELLDDVDLPGAVGRDLWTTPDLLDVDLDDAPL